MTFQFLQSLAADPLWVDNRRNSIGGSDSNVIMGVDPNLFTGVRDYDDGEAPDPEAARVKRLLRLWKEKRGEEPPEDLSDKLFVVMGLFTEPLNQAWFEKHTGLFVTREDVGMVSERHPWRTCTLDGWIGRDAIWEAKHCTSFRRDTEIMDAYMPQLHHNMDVCGVRKAHLSVIRGNSDWFHVEVDYDDAYGQAVLTAEEAFWACVKSGEPPVATAAPKPPRMPGWRDYDLSESNSWAVNAPLWLECSPAARRLKDVVEALKGSIPDDAKTASAFGVKASVAKNGAVRFTAVGEVE